MLGRLFIMSKLQFIDFQKCVWQGGGGVSIDVIMVTTGISAALPYCVLPLGSRPPSSQAASPGKSPWLPHTSQVEG